MHQTIIGGWSSASRWGPISNKLVTTSAADIPQTNLPNMAALCGGEHGVPTATLGEHDERYDRQRRHLPEWAIAQHRPPKYQGPLGGEGHQRDGRNRSTDDDARESGIDQHEARNVVHR